MSLAVFGDVHGNVGNLRRQLESFAPWEEPQYGFILGDAGLSYGSFASWGLKWEMDRMKSVTWLVMRGNHDDRYFEENLGKDGYHVEDVLGTTCLVEHNFPNIKYLNDSGCELEYDGKKILAVPGAYSIDKYYRLATGSPFTPDEQLNKYEMDCLYRLACNGRYDIVLSHTCPRSWHKNMSDVLTNGLDETLIDHTMENFLDKVLDKVQENNVNYRWYFGHYHGDKEVVKDHANLVYHNALVVA